MKGSIAKKLFCPLLGEWCRGSECMFWNHYRTSKESTGKLIAARNPETGLTETKTETIDVEYGDCCKADR